MDASANGSAPQLREYLPTTEASIIWQGRWKLITSAGLGGSQWYPAHGRGPNNTAIPASVKDWPCVDTTEAEAAAGGCLICSPKKPCLFDLLNDESERVNLAQQKPELATQLAQQLASYVPYVDGSMSQTELDKYDCVKGGKYPHPWWGNFTGPCCRPKGSYSA